MRKEYVCKHLSKTQEGSILECLAYDDDTVYCPKSRSRGIITTACWRVRPKA